MSAALILGRARRRVLVCDMGSPRNAPAAEMRGFISRDGASPSAFLKTARQELKRYPSVQLNASACVAARSDGQQRFHIALENGEQHAGRRLLFTTGVVDVLPEIPGLAPLWGRSVFVCPYCDGWEVQDRRLAVFGAPHSGIELAQELYQWSRDILICGYQDELATVQQKAWLKKSGVQYTSSFIRSLAGSGGKLQTIEFVDGSRAERDALFMGVALAQRSELPERLGCELTSEGRIAIDARHRTSVDGCYAAGDAVTAMHQVIVAAASGVSAAVRINDDLTQDDVAAIIG